jgi:hypothetical protein
MLTVPTVRRVVSTLGVIAVPVLASCDPDSDRAPTTAANETLTLSQLGESRLPARVDEYSVNTGEAALQYEVYVERGQLTLAGIPASAYNVEVHFATYAVSTVNGRRTLTLVGTQREIDRGRIRYDTTGTMTLTSEYVAPLSHTAHDITTGILMAFRVPGDDQVLDLHYRRDAN